MCLMRLCCMVPLVAASCLPDAIPELARKDLVKGEEHYAVGLWVNNWPASYAAVELIQIIIQDSGPILDCLLRFGFRHVG